MTPDRIGDRRRLTRDEWAQVRRRWEGSPVAGFAWLAAEIDATWGVPISRVAVSNMSRKPGAAWAKGPLEDAPLPWKPRTARAQAPGIGSPLSVQPASLVAALEDFLQWAGADPCGARRNQFSVAYARARETQVALLIQGSAAGAFDPVQAAESFRTATS